MRPILIFIGIIVAIGIAWNQLITEGGVVKYYDDHPDKSSAPSVLFNIARGFDLFDNPKRALEIYQRVSHRYVDSSYAMEAHYGVASCYERLKDYDSALVYYEKFAKLYPNSKYIISVENNIDILKNR